MNEAARVAALTLDGVERRYGRGETTVEVLNGASLELSPGQSVALIAPSGAESRRSCIWRACWSGPTPAKSRSAALRLRP